MKYIILILVLLYPLNVEAANIKDTIFDIVYAAYDSGKNSTQNCNSTYVDCKSFLTNYKDADTVANMCVKTCQAGRSKTPMDKAMKSVNDYLAGIK